MRKDFRYVKIAEALRTEMSALGPNTALPTEHQLAKRFEVSRVTVRHALDLLQRSGLITRQRGRGTTTNPPKITRHTFPLIWLEDDLKRQGIAYETRVLEHDVAHAPPDFVATLLRLDRPQSVEYLSLARLVDDKVFCHEARYFAVAIANKLTNELIESRPLHRLLSEIAGCHIDTVELTTEILPSNTSVAAAMNVNPGTLILANTYTHRLRDGSLIEAGVTSYRLDLCKFKAHGRISELPFQEEQRAPEVDRVAMIGGAPGG